VRFLVSLGYAVVEPNVRGSTGFGRAFEEADNQERRTQALADVATVNAWTNAQPWCDPNRVAIWGASYGGYTTLMALTRTPTAWRAGVDLYGPADLLALLRGIPEDARVGAAAEFGDPNTQAAMLTELSPIRDVERIVAPLFVYAGQNDPRVPRRESDTIVQAMRDREMHVEYMVAADEGHNVERRDNQIELMTRTARFLAEAMGPP
jgi:dipeptidyl aminopeptidase/acylaminoacyl peptidase